MKKRRRQHVKPTPSPKTYAELTGAARRYIDFRVEGNDQKAAYRKAGFAGKSSGAAAQIEKRYKSALQERLEKISERSEITAARILQEIDRVALARLDQVMSWGGKIKLDPDGGLPTIAELFDSANLPEEVRAAVKSIKISPAGQVTIEMHSKDKALELAARARGMLTDRLETTDVPPAQFYTPRNDRISDAEKENAPP